MGNLFTGLIDEVELFNVAVPAASIQSIVNAASSGKYRPTAPQIAALETYGLVSLALGLARLGGIALWRRRGARRVR